MHAQGGSWSQYSSKVVGAGGEGGGGWRPGVRDVSTLTRGPCGIRRTGGWMKPEEKELGGQGVVEINTVRTRVPKHGSSRPLIILSSII
jgi:hypothetical protein